MRRVSVAALVALLAVPAGAWGGIGPEPYTRWAARAAHRGVVLPTPDVRVEWAACPATFPSTGLFGPESPGCALPGTIWLVPSAYSDLSAYSAPTLAQAKRRIFFHELGHQLDWTLPDSARGMFSAIMHNSRAWRDGGSASLEEQFAWAYSAIARGLTWRACRWESAGIGFYPTRYQYAHLERFFRSLGPSA